MDRPQDAAPQSSLRTRVVAAAVGAPLLLASVLWPGGDWPFRGWPFALVVLALLLIGLREFDDGCRQDGLTPRDPFGMLASLLFFLSAIPALNSKGAGDPSRLAFAVTVLVILSLSVEALRKSHAPLKSLAPPYLGAVYVGWLFPFALRLRLDPEIPSRLGWSIPADWNWMHGVGEGALLVVFTIVVTSSVDTGAYFAGRALGRHKLAPEVSPSKTWEGSVGGFIAALIVGGLLGLWLRLPLPFALAAAGLIGVLAQLGDLGKSAVKREIGIKDFGALIPGHGGVLDRFDSLLFTAPAVYWLMQFWRA